ncbi:MAG TPA: hypothetical protein VEF33_12205, partial [Syntrophales bacterium]|nr:hypothetical protein [Syntrophales bacterium]
MAVLPIACGGGGSNDGGGSQGNNRSVAAPPQVIATAGPNVQTIYVNGGPTASILPASGGYIYPNAAFTSVTVCAPGTSNCQTI